MKAAVFLFMDWTTKLVGGAGYLSMTDDDATVFFNKLVNHMEANNAE